jgi:hypothetical protein
MQSEKLKKLRRKPEVKLSQILRIKTKHQLATITKVERKRRLQLIQNKKEIKLQHIKWNIAKKDKTKPIKRNKTILNPIMSLKVVLKLLFIKRKNHHLKLSKTINNSTKMRKFKMRVKNITMRRT